MAKDLFDTKSEAKKRADELGCKGTHAHKDGDKVKFMPCGTHKQWEKKSKDNSPKGKNKEEIDELIDFDGTMTNSKIPILDPHLHPKKTTDQTVATARIVQDPLLRGFRQYYGESTVKEEDMSDAFGYEETQFMDAEETIKFLEKELGLEPENAEMRADEFGKSEDRDEKSEFKNKKGFVGKPILKEKNTKTFTKEDILKMSEEILMSKEDGNDLQQKEKDASDILKRNIKVLKSQADAEGISSSQLIKMIKSE